MQKQEQADRRHKGGQPIDSSMPYNIQNLSTYLITN